MASFRKTTSDKYRTWARMYSRLISLSLSAILIATRLTAQESFSFDQAQSFLKTYCQACHQGKSAVGGFNLEAVNTPASLQSNAQKWTRLNLRVIHGEMPPKNAPAPTLDAREQFSK